MSRYQVVFHIDELLKWRLLLNNVNNLLNAESGDTFDIEVVANSEAVKQYIASQDNTAETHDMEELNNKGVRFVACRNALAGLSINKEALLHFVGIVPAGVLELVHKQSQGYAYIKP